MSKHLYTPLTKENTMFTIQLPKKKIRNPHAVDAQTRKSGPMKPPWEKRKGNPKKQDWKDGY